MDETVWNAYLQRIAVPRPLGVDTVTLHVLHRAHQLTVPFENLSMHLAEPISLADEDLIDKIVRRGRGGICYELNGAFALLLQSLDVEVTRVAARVYGDDGKLGIPLDHMALIVRPSDGSGPWLADVGFGRHSTYPLLFDSRHEQEDPGGTFRLADTPDGDVDVFRDGRPQYRIEARAFSQTDFVPTCWWQQTSPDSHFTQSTICSRLTETGRISLSDRTLIITDNGVRTEQLLPSDQAVLDAYRQHFNITLDRLPQVLFPPPQAAAPEAAAPQAPFAAPSPAPSVPQAPQPPQAPQASQTPQSPPTSASPAPQASQDTEAPQASPAPQAPRVPQASHVPEAPRVPKAPQAPEAPQAPNGAQGSADSPPQAPRASQAPAASQPPGASDTSAWPPAPAPSATPAWLTR